MHEHPIGPLDNLAIVSIAHPAMELDGAIDDIHTGVQQVKLVGVRLRLESRDQDQCVYVLHLSTGQR